MFVLCFQQFCLHDDYNWDWTIQHLSMKCIPGKIRLLKMKASRVFHIGEWWDSKVLFLSCFVLFCLFIIFIIIYIIIIVIINIYIIIYIIFYIIIYIVIYIII